MTNEVLEQVHAVSEALQVANELIKSQKVQQPTCKSNPHEKEWLDVFVLTQCC